MDDPDLADLLRRVLALPIDARAALAGSLLDSLDGPVEVGAEAAWDTEIASRIEELDSGRRATIPWFEVRRSLHQR